MTTLENRKELVRLQLKLAKLRKAELESPSDPRLSTSTEKDSTSLLTASSSNQNAGADSTGIVESTGPLGPESGITLRDILTDKPLPPMSRVRPFGPTMSEKQIAQWRSAHPVGKPSWKSPEPMDEIIAPVLPAAIRAVSDHIRLVKEGKAE